MSGEAPDPREQEPRCAMCRSEELALDGDGLCGPCREQSDVDHARIRSLEIAGHDGHCAARMVWGDGQCTCEVLS